MLMNDFARGVYRSQNSVGGEPYLVCVCCSCSSGRQRQTPLLSLVHSPSVWRQAGMVIDVDCSWLVVFRKLESARERRVKTWEGDSWSCVQTPGLPVQSLQMPRSDRKKRFKDGKFWYRLKLHPGCRLTTGWHTYRRTPNRKTSKTRLIMEPQPTKSILELAAWTYLIRSTACKNKNINILHKI